MYRHRHARYGGQGVCQTRREFPPDGNEAALNDQLRGRSAQTHNDGAGAGRRMVCAR
jgi:hypothetical protein